MITRAQNRLQRGSRGEVDDVGASARAFRCLIHEIDRRILRLARSRLQIRAIGRSFRSADELWQFRVDEQRRVRVAQLPHRSFEAEVVEKSELGDAGVYEETFESKRPFAQNRLQL